MAVYEVKVEDHSAAYLAEVSAEIRKAVDDLGYDLQSVARQAAPEKTGNLVKHILVKSSAADGAYQAELGSTAVDPITGNDYVDWMHNGKYRLGRKSKAKGMASSRIGKFRKRVGPNYIAGSGELAISGYQSYMEKRISAVNNKYS